MVLARIETPDQVLLLAVGVAVGVLVACLLVSGKVALRQRTLWIAFVLVIVTATAVWDGIEIRFERGTDAFYWRSDWDWDTGGGGLTEWVAATALAVGPWVAAALAYSSVVSAGVRRIAGVYKRILLYVLPAPLAFVLAFGLMIALYAHPLVFYSERTS